LVQAPLHREGAPSSSPAEGEAPHYIPEAISQIGPVENKETSGAKAQEFVRPILAESRALSILSEVVPSRCMFMRCVLNVGAVGHAHGLLFLGWQVYRNGDFAFVAQDA
jgi:hypothetical protein